MVAAAEPGGMVLTGDAGDLRALAEHAREVTIGAIRQAGDGARAASPAGTLSGSERHRAVDGADR